MSEIQESGARKMLCIKKANVTVSLWNWGERNIHVFGLSKEELKDVATLTGKKIKDYQSTFWVELSKARDKSQVTFFQE